MAYEMGLHKWLILSKHSEEKGIRTVYKNLGCLFEAFLAAVFLDLNKINIKDEDKWFDNLFVTGPGFQMSQIFLESIFEQHIDWINLIQNDDNFKNQIQVKIQKKFKVTPCYLDIYEQHNNMIDNVTEYFTRGIYICLGQETYEVTHANSICISTFKNIQELDKYIFEKTKVLIFLGSGKHKIKKKAEQIAGNIALENPIINDLIGTVKSKYY